MSEVIKKLLGDLYTPEIAEKLDGKQYMEYEGEHSPIPYGRFKTVNDKKNEYEAEVGKLTSSIETLKTSNGDVESIKQQLSDTTADFDNYKTRIAEEEAGRVKLAELKRKKVMATEMFTEAKALSPSLLVSLVDFDKVTIDSESDNTLGLKEQVDRIKVEHAGQFGVVQNDDPPIKHGGNQKMFGDLTSSERLKWKTDDPKGYEAARVAYKATR